MHLLQFSSSILISHDWSQWLKLSSGKTSDWNLCKWYVCYYVQTFTDRPVCLTLCHLNCNFNSNHIFDSVLPFLSLNLLQWCDLRLLFLSPFYSVFHFLGFFFLFIFVIVYVYIVYISQKEMLSCLLCKGCFFFLTFDISNSSLLTLGESFKV